VQSKKSRLDRFLSVKTGTPKGDIRLLLAQKRVQVDGRVATDAQQVIDQFSHIALDGEILQSNIRRYVMLNKPVGVVSATKDDQHTTVLDLLSEYNNGEFYAPDLHIVGRLDLNSSGLLLLTNDGEWSRHLMSPENKVAKVYEVTVENPITDECIQAFSDGIYFPFEDITTKPAKLERISECVGRVTLEEGRYHQIKRMFGRFRNPVLKLHRTAVGKFQLDDKLLAGQAKTLSNQRIVWGNFSPDS
jgi:16S rRNA pseudouridine516 synthase